MQIDFPARDSQSGSSKSTSGSLPAVSYGGGRSQPKVRSVQVEGLSSETTLKSNRCSVMPSDGKFTCSNEVTELAVKVGASADLAQSCVADETAQVSTGSPLAGPRAVDIGMQPRSPVCGNLPTDPCADEVQHVGENSCNFVSSEQFPVVEDSADFALYSCDVNEGNDNSDCLVLKTHLASASTTVNSTQIELADKSEALSQLEYIAVRISEVPSANNFSALVDTGSEICVIHQRMLGTYDYHVCGQVKLRGIVGNSVTANLTYLTIQLADDPQCSVKTLCAISDQVNEDFLVTRTLVNQLHQQYNSRLLTKTDVSVKCLPSNSEINASENCEDRSSVDSLVTDHNVRRPCDANSRTDIENSEAAHPQRELLDVDNVDSSSGSDLGHASVEALRQEQLANETLVGCWALAKRDKGGYFVRDSLLFRCEKIFGRPMRT
jgi:hypothetical protein